MGSNPAPPPSVLERGSEEAGRGGGKDAYGFQ